MEMESTTCLLQKRRRSDADDRQQHSESLAKCGCEVPCAVANNEVASGSTADTNWVQIQVQYHDCRTRELIQAACTAMKHLVFSNNVYRLKLVSQFWEAADSYSPRSKWLDAARLTADWWRL